MASGSRWFAPGLRNELKTSGNLGTRLSHRCCTCALLGTNHRSVQALRAHWHHGRSHIVDIHSLAIRGHWKHGCIVRQLGLRVTDRKKKKEKVEA